MTMRVGWGRLTRRSHLLVSLCVLVAAACDPSSQSTPGSKSERLAIVSFDDALDDKSSPTADAETFWKIFSRGQESFRQKDYASAFKDWRSLAVLGSQLKDISTVARGAKAYFVLMSQILVGWCYDHGYGVGQDKSKALSFYKKPAKFGIPFLQYEVAIRYDDGVGVQRDRAEAARWYRRAGEAGVVDAQFLLGNRYSKGDGVEKDVREAVKWYRLAAESGHSHSQAQMAFAYLLAEGVERNCEKARHWAKRAQESAKSAVEKVGARVTLDMIQAAESLCR